MIGRALPLFILALAIAPAAAKEQRTGFLGVSVAPASDELRQLYGLPEKVKSGAVIQEVVEGSAAAAAGFKTGDVLVEFGGTRIEGPEGLVEAVRRFHEGDVVRYKLIRGSREISDEIKLGGRREERVDMELVEVEPGAPPRPVRPRRDYDDIGRRLEKAQEQVTRMRLRLHSGFGGQPLQRWIAREEAALVEARKAGDEPAVLRSEHRLELLKEMRKAGDREPSRPQHWKFRELKPSRWEVVLLEPAAVVTERERELTKRLDRLEKRFEQLLERLEAAQK
ncbi:MAG: PDZ domain-containing protein [Planctomycetota bacterium]|nr:PDZ domain-containing protein [Planctomycetota bacterium]